MMITEQMIYWITRMDFIVGMLMFLATLFLVASISSAVLIFSLYDDSDRIKQIIITSVLLFITVLFSLAVIFTPNTKAMIAIKVIPKISNNEEIKGLTDKTMQLINGKLSEWLDNLVDTKENK